MVPLNGALAQKISLEAAIQRGSLGIGSDAVCFHVPMPEVYSGAKYEAAVFVPFTPPAQPPMQ
jgi:hypothetical protein